MMLLHQQKHRLTSLGARAMGKRLLATSPSDVLDFSEIPSPQKDSKQYEASPEPTHVEVMMQLGGPQKLDKFHKHLYNINDIVQFRFPGSRPSVTIFDPDEMLKIHKAAGPTPVGSAALVWPIAEYYKRQKKYEGIPMAMTTNSATWKRLRHAMQQGLFGYDEAESFVPLFSAVSKDIVKLLPSNQDNVFPYLNRATFELIHSVLFGHRANVLDLSKADPLDVKFVKSTISVFTLGAVLQYHPTAGLIPKADFLPKEMLDLVPKEAWEMWEQFLNDEDNVVDIGAKKIQQLMKDDVENKYKSDPSLTKPLLVRYLSAGELTEGEIVLNVAGLLQGGVDTTANTLMWCLTRLAQYPHVQKPLRDELRSIKPDRDSLFNTEQLKSLKLMSSFIDETMRFAPTAAGYLRITTEDCNVFSRRRNQTYRIPKGTEVMFSSQMQRDPKIVSQPEEFKLDRYTRACKHARRGTPEAKIDSPVSDVFSYGPRMCLGARLAKMELLSVLAEIVQTYEIAFTDPSIASKIETSNTLLSRPDPEPQFKFTAAA